jgi:hypothetical protein
MTTHSDRMHDTRAEVVGAQKPGAGAPVDNRQMQAGGYGEERTSVGRQNGISVTERTAIVRETERRPAVDVEQISGAPLADACGYDAFEPDFRGHHQTNAARSRGPYEHYRLIYRYGYDLGVDPRYRGAEWATVEQEARPRWEERNPNTWEQFKEMIQYAWETVRSQP